MFDFSILQSSIVNDSGPYLQAEPVGAWAQVWGVGVSVAQARQGLCVLQKKIRPRKFCRSREPTAESLLGRGLPNTRQKNIAGRVEPRL